jgi:hypothetical protein
MGVKQARKNLHHQNICGLLALILICLSTAGYASGDGGQPSSEAIDAKAYRQQVEADWLLQEKYRATPEVVSGAITTEEDARGGCDGIKDGQYGFHTAEEQDPWWQVDLRQVHTLSKVVIWNRCDGVAPRASNLLLLLSNDGMQWEKVYTHDGKVFLGFTDNKPLVVELDKKEARLVRIQLQSKDWLHLDEVEVFGPGDPQCNLALNHPSDQSSMSPFSNRTRLPATIDWDKRVTEILTHCRELLAEAGALDSSQAEAIKQLQQKAGQTKPEEIGQEIYLQARWLQRSLTLSQPLLDFEAIHFTKRVPGVYNHMSDQYYGWWSRPGGGLFVLRNYKTGAPQTECISTGFTESGSFLRPALSYDGGRLLFAWCRHYPGVAELEDKLTKSNVPEDAFYHLYEMDLGTRQVRQLTNGKYDDFDGRYLPDDRIVFLSTRRGQAFQCGPETAARTVAAKDMPDSYVRCGGGPQRPVAVYTLHTMNADGGNLIPISPFENFEWNPSVSADGAILHSRWDYIDRDNMPFMGLWATNPDGTNPRLVYKNFTRSPHCTFEPHSIPGSRKIVITASGHHAQTMGSLVLLDPAVGTEGDAPIKRLTPEVPFPEIEGWPETYYANPWPLSERFYLVAWGIEETPSEGKRLAPNGMGIYLFDAEGNMELLYRDPNISSVDPIPLRPRQRPPVLPSTVDWSKPKEGCFLLADVYRGLDSVKRGDIKALRIIGVPGKTHPTMNSPSIGITRDDPGKCVLGTVPVEPDGSAYFRSPAGVIVFFQALDSQGMALQTMRSATHVQPGQTLSCVGCHEPRNQAPPPATVLASLHEPSKITVGPDGSWPLRFDRLIQPVLDQHCVSCHHPGGPDTQAAKLDLTPEAAYESLIDCGTPSLREAVTSGYHQGYSTPGTGLAKSSRLLSMLSSPEGHHEVRLDTGSLERFILWMDTYAQKAGSFSPEQEQELIEFRKSNAGVFIEREWKQSSIEPIGAGQGG